MKKFRKIMAVLVAAMMIMATMVPAWAESGRLEGTLVTDHAKITIDNPKYMETYYVYRLFELASFNDPAPATGQHTDNSGNVNEQYSYVIKDGEWKDDNDHSLGLKPSWFTFLTTYGPNGPVTGSEVPYAVPSQSANASSAYFTYSEELVTIDGESYRIIKGTDNFKYDRDDTSSNTNRADEGASAGVDYVNPDVPTTATSNKKVQDFAQEAYKYATDTNNNITLITSQRYEATDGSALVLLNNTGTADTKPKNLGYYLIGSSMGTLVALDTTNNEVVAHEKNDEPKIEKYVKDGDDWARNTDANIDDLVQFRTIITAEQGVKNYVLHDVMEKGLSFVNTSSNPLTVSLLRKGVANPAYDAQNPGDTPATIDVTYEIKAAPSNVNIGGSQTGQNRTNYVLNETPGDGSDFTITFKDADGLNGAGAATGYGSDKVTFLVLPDGKQYYEYIDIKDGDQIIVDYWARLNSNATIFGTDETATGDLTAMTYSDASSTVLDDSLQIHRDYNADAEGIQRNDNYTILTYGNLSNTTPARASVTTYQFDVAKTKDDASNDMWSLLGGAEFSLYRVKVTTEGQGEPAANFTVGNTKYAYDGVSKALKFDAAATVGDTVVYKYAGDTATAAMGTTLDTLQKIVTVDNKTVNIEGLQQGTYILQEDVAPIGYDKLAHPLVITITDRTSNANVTAETNEGKINISGVNNNGTPISKSLQKWHAVVDASTKKYDATSANVGGVQIVNTTSTELPSTGGMGTTVLYIVGGMLVILAGAYLFFSRKKTA